MSRRNVALTAALLAACHSDEEKKEAPEPLFAEEVAPLEGEPCAGGGLTPLDATVEIRPFLGRGASAGALRREIASARRYLARYGVELEPAADLTKLELRAALGSTARELEGALRDAGIRAGGPGEQAGRAREITAGLIAAPLRALLENHAVPPRAEVNVILLERITARRSPIAAHLPRLFGLTLSPLLDQGEQPAADIRAALDLGRYTPTVLLAQAELARLSPALRRTVLAHELGHALGLPHRPERENLMAPKRRRDCVPILAEDQREVLERGLLQQSER